MWKVIENEISKIVNEEKNEENLQLFQVAKVNCEHELIKSVINCTYI